MEQFWTVALAHKQATRYRVGRVFLVGDAGHVHTPFGGQGLNLGIGDAASLGWRLSAVLAGRAPEALLASYEAERLAVGRQVIGFTHLGASAMPLRGDPRRHLRDAAMGRGGLHARAPPARRPAAVSAHAHLPWHAGRIGQGARAGRRGPPARVELYDTSTDQALRLHGRETVLLRRLQRAGHDPRDVRLIALTHCHPDHAGGAAELQQRFGVPVAVPRCGICGTSSR